MNERLPVSVSGGKSPLASKTVWGGIVLMCTIILQSLGVEFSDGELAHLESLIGGLVGFGFVIWGRVTARQAIDAKQVVPGVHLLALCMALAVLLPTGCNTLSDSQKETGQEILKGAAQIAVMIGLQELGSRVNEVRPYTDHLMARISVPFAEAEDPEVIGEMLAREVRETVPEAYRAEVWLALLEALEAESMDGPVASGSGRDQTGYNRRIVEGLTR